MEEPEKKSDLRTIFIGLYLVVWVIVYWQIADEISGTLGSAGEYQIFVIAFQVVVSGFVALFPTGMLYVIPVVIGNIINYRKPPKSKKPKSLWNYVLIILIIIIVGYLIV